MFIFSPEFDFSIFFSITIYIISLQCTRKRRTRGMNLCIHGECTKRNSAHMENAQKESKIIGRMRIIAAILVGKIY
jgi:hypothetical protein